MVLSTHIVIGAAVAQLFPNHPILAFAAGWGSHYLMDSIPHWDYKLKSAETGHNNKIIDLKFGKDFLRDLVKIVIDVLLGFAIVLGFIALLPGQNYLATLLGIMGGVLPDALQFVYFKFRHEPFIGLKKLHDWCEAKIKITDPGWGIGSQIFVAVIAIILAKII